jgi:glutamyl-tRNA reductase
MDYLSQLTDETLENRKKHIPAAEAIIEEIKEIYHGPKDENLPQPFTL